MTEEKKNTEKERTEKAQSRTLWMISTVVLLIAAIALAAYSFSGGITGNVAADGTGTLTGDVIGMDDFGDMAIDFFNTRLSQTPGILVDVSETKGMYEVVINIQGQEVPLYFTKDGYWIAQGRELISITDLPPTPSTQPSGVIKSDAPEVELFVMTHCPYGTQAEKAMIPAIKELGDTVDAKVRFVHYFMHGEEEETETYRQVCIREEHPDVYMDYLACFLEDGDSARCLEQYNLDVSSCMESNAEEYYAEDSALSEGYGVSGSPTLVLNGAIISFTRSPAGALSTVCSAFNEQPEACSAELSTAGASPGFGYSEGSDTGGSC
jgi:protein-disulfide isomerase